eukprot:gene3260-4082_t
MLQIEHILECINGLIGPNYTKLYEEKLKVLEKEPGYGAFLATIAANSSQGLDVFVRQMACILLKGFIKNSWDSISDDEKTKIKSILPPCLSDPSHKIRTAMAMCIGRIGSYDWPERWPTLVDELIGCIRPQQTEAGEHLLNGAIQCLEILCDPEYLDEDQTKKMIEIVFPRTVGYMVLMDKKLSVAISPSIDTWIKIFTRFLSKRIEVRGSDKTINEEFTILAGILEILTTLFTDLPKRMSRYVEGLLPPIWNLFTSTYPLYEKSEILPDGTIPIDLDEDVTRVDFLVSQLLGDKKYRNLFEPFLNQLFYNSMLYLQMTYDLMLQWQNDTNQFLDTEDDSSFTARVVSGNLILRVCELYKEQGLKALFETIQALLQKAQDKQQNPNWWRIREASILALCITSELYANNKNKIFDVNSFLTNYLVQDFNLQGDSDQIVLLKSRSIICASKFSSYADTQISLEFFKKAIEMVGFESNPLPTKIAAIKAIGNFMSAVPMDILIQLVPPIVKSTIALLPQLTEDSLLVVLDSLIQMTKINKDITGELEPILTPSLLSTWTSYANDPQISEDIKEIFKIICTAPKSYPGIIQHLAQTFEIILKSHDQPLYLSMSESAVDILGVVISSYREAVDPNILDQLLAPLISIILTGEGSIVKAALVALQPFIYRIPPTFMVQWKHPNGYTGLQCIFLIIQKNLPVQDEFLSMNVPPLISGVILKYTDYIQQDIPKLLDLGLSTLHTCKLPSFKQALISIFARLVLLYPEQVIDYLYNIKTTNGSTALEFLLNEWNKYHEDIQDKLNLNVSVMALVKILNMNDPRIESLIIDGALIDDGLPRTRRMVSKKDLKYTRVRAIDRMINNLYDTLQLESMDQRKVKKYNPESDEEDDFDEDLYEEAQEQDGDGDDSFAPAEDYEDIIEEADALQNDSEYDLYDPISKEDPLYSLDIVKYIGTFLISLPESNPALREKVQSTVRDNIVKYMENL